MKVLMSPNPLHIPDGFLSVPISIIFWILTVGLLYLAVNHSRGHLSERQVPLMGVMAAFIFAAQMINFPVAGGTSGHLLGGALAAITLGPWAGMLVMAAVIGVQALLFQDGGLLAMGANIFNMGLVTVLVAYGLYRVTAGKKLQLQFVVVAVAAWLSVMTGALLTSFQLWLSGTTSLRLVFPAMLGVHALVGIGEALITVAALGFILRTRPDLLGRLDESYGSKGWIVGGILVALFVILLAPFASGNPDGLERVAINLGFIDAGQDASYQILPNYRIPVLGSSNLSVILAGVLGVAVVALFVIFVVRLVRKST